MGYTTKFKGQFALSALPAAEIIVGFNDLEYADREVRPAGAPDSYNQWVLTKDCRGLKWNGGEKFYLYDEWLQWIMDNFLTPHGITLSGEVQWSGEDADDIGVLAIEGTKVVKRKLALVSDELDELIRFKKFVLDSRFADELLSEWRRKKDGR